MTNKEIIQRNIGLTFDFLREIVKDPSIIDDIADGATIEFVEKDYVKKEKEIRVRGRKYVEVKQEFTVL